MEAVGAAVDQLWILCRLGCDTPIHFLAGAQDHSGGAAATTFVVLSICHTGGPFTAAGLGQLLNLVLLDAECLIPLPSFLCQETASGTALLRVGHRTLGKREGCGVQGQGPVIHSPRQVLPVLNHASAFPTCMDNQKP